METLLSFGLLRCLYVVTTTTASFLGKFDASPLEKLLATVPPRADGSRGDLPPFRNLCVSRRAIDDHGTVLSDLSSGLIFNQLTHPSLRHDQAGVGDTVVQQKHDNLHLALMRVGSLWTCLGFVKFPFFSAFRQRPWFRASAFLLHTHRPRRFGCRTAVRLFLSDCCGIGGHVCYRCRLFCCVMVPKLSLVTD